jgi:hypothetical protein
MTTQSQDIAAPAENPTVIDNQSPAPSLAQPNAAAEESNGTDAAPTFGWNAYAERLNGRFAMIGFAALLIMQLFTRQDFWTWIGL